MQTRTLESFALGDTDDVNHLVLGKHSRHRDRLLEVLAGPVNLLGYSTTVHLDLHNVGLLLALAKKFHLRGRSTYYVTVEVRSLNTNYLGMGNDADYFAVALHRLQIPLDNLLAKIILPLL